MQSFLIWSGTVAGALIAVGTVLRWLLRRSLAAVRFLSQLAALPGIVDELATTVRTLNGSVDQLHQELHHQHTRPLASLSLE